MMKFWPPTPLDQLTPKAGPDGREQLNPFFSDISPSPATQTPTSSAAATNTPTTPNYHHHLLGAPALYSPQITVTGRSIGTYTGLTPPAGPLTPGGLNFASAIPTTHLSLHAPEFNM